MCGIVGILSAQAVVEPRQTELLRMLKALLHRGPDGHDIWWNGSGTAGLGHSRLAVIDPGEGGAQPMRSACGRWVVVFNGEIYNHRELRAELLQQGVCFRGQSDTEVLLELHRCEGVAALKRLRGMYALCIWDEQEQTALLARDACGIKPLLYAEAQGALLFGSELRSLMAAGRIKPRPNALAIEDLLATGSISEPATLFEGVHMLGAGEHLLWRRGVLCFGTHAGPRQKLFEGSRQDAVAMAATALRQSVQRHLVSDVPLGLLLSGGMDSTAILALAREGGYSGLQTFCVGLQGEWQNEADLAARTASHFGVQHHNLFLGEHEALAMFDPFLAALDQPGVDGFNVFVISSLIAKQGLKVALSGLGGDECFGGYPSFRWVPRLRRWHQVLGGRGWRHWQELPLRGRWRRLAEFFAGPGQAAQAQAAVRQLRARADAGWLTQAMLGGKTQSLVEDQACHGPYLSLADEIADLESRGYLRNQLLRDADIYSMAHGVEMRVPWVDETLGSTLAALPSAWRFAPGKSLLSDAVGGLPSWVLRGKNRRGFLFPFGKWMQGPWGARINEASRGAPLPQETWYQRWTLFVLREALARYGVMNPRESLFNGGLRS
jgi:asparagine synthase (glutamine-hydrolysing)